MFMTLVSLNDVYKYDVIKPYTLDIKKGECLVLVGKNGSGKTTLIKLILGFIKPDRGSITRTKMHISYLPEQMALPHFMAGYLFLKLHARMKKCDIKPRLLHLFDVPLYRYVHEMSKGNQQKLSLIATFIGQAELVLLDEPLSGLDEKSIDFLIDYLHELKNTGTTIVLSSHQPERFEKLQTRILKL